MTKGKEMLTKFLEISNLDYSKYKQLKLREFIRSLQELDKKDNEVFFTLLSESIAGKDTLIHIASPKKG